MKKVVKNLGLLARQAILILADVLLINASYLITAALNNGSAAMRLITPMLLTRALVRRGGRHGRIAQRLRRQDRQRAGMVAHGQL